REVVGAVEREESGLGVVLEDVLVEFRNEVFEGAPMVAERHAAVYSPGGLAPRPLLAEGVGEFRPVVESLGLAPLGRCRATPLHEASHLTQAASALHR